MTAGAKATINNPNNAVLSNFTDASLRTESETSEQSPKLRIRYDLTALGTKTIYELLGSLILSFCREGP